YHHSHRGQSAAYERYLGLEVGIIHAAIGLYSAGVLFCFSGWQQLLFPDFPLTHFSSWAGYDPAGVVAAGAAAAGAGAARDTLERPAGCAGRGVAGFRAGRAGLADVAGTY